MITSKLSWWYHFVEFFQESDIFKYWYHYEKLSEKDWAIISTDSNPLPVIFFKGLFYFLHYIVNFFITYSDFWDPITTFFIIDFTFFFTPYTAGEIDAVSPAIGTFFLGGLTTVVIFSHFWTYVYMFTFTSFNFFLRFFHNSFNDFVYFDLDYLILFDSKLFSFFFFFHLFFYFLKSIFYIWIFNSNIFFFIFWFGLIYYIFFSRNDILFSTRSLKFNFNYILIFKEYFKKTRTFRHFLLKRKKYKNSSKF